MKLSIRVLLIVGSLYNFITASQVIPTLLTYLTILATHTTYFDRLQATLCETIVFTINTTIDGSLISRNDTPCKNGGTVADVRWKKLL